MKLVNVFYYLYITDGTNSARITEDEAYQLLEFLTYNKLLKFNVVRDDGTIVKAWCGSSDEILIQVGDVMLLYPVWSAFMWGLDVALKSLEGAPDFYEQLEC